MWCQYPQPRFEGEGGEEEVWIPSWLCGTSILGLASKGGEVHVVPVPSASLLLPVGGIRSRGLGWLAVLGPTQRR